MKISPYRNLAGFFFSCLMFRRLTSPGNWVVSTCKSRKCHSRQQPPTQHFPSHQVPNCWLPPDEGRVCPLTLGDFGREPSPPPSLGKSLVNLATPFDLGLSPSGLPVSRPVRLPQRSCLLPPHSQLQFDCWGR